MRRLSALITLLIIGSLACGLFTTATPQLATPKQPTPAVSTIKPTGTATSEPSGTQPATLEATPTSAKEESTITPYPTSALDSAMSTEVNLIQSQVVEERQLKAKYSVPVVLLTRDQLGQKETNDYQTDYTDEEAAADIYEYTSSGLLDPGFDLRAFIIKLLSEQVIGEYDSETKEMFVVSDEGFLGYERLTYSHEYTHALQDQNFDLENGLKMNDEDCEANDDRCEAVLALVEGDATLSMAYWFQYYATKTDQQQYQDFANNLKEPVYDSAPAYLKEDFDFPYNQGLTFVLSMHEQGGWDAVDAVFRNPPASTEQILHPSLYPSDTPVKVDLPNLTSALGTAWREVRRDTMGEWYTYLILARGTNSKARLDDGTAQNAAAGWGGDEFLVLHNDTANTTAFVMKTVWDTDADAAEFSTALQKYANTRFGVKATQQGDNFSWVYQSGFSSLYHSGNTTIWIVAPDAATGQTILTAVQS